MLASQNKLICGLKIDINQNNLRQNSCRRFAKNINTFLFCLKSAKADLDMTANFGLGVLKEVVKGMK